MSPTQIWASPCQRLRSSAGPAFQRASSTSWVAKGRPASTRLRSLSEEQRKAAVALFETGWGAAATRLGVRHQAIRGLYDRWGVRGGTTLVTKPTKRLFSFEFKLDAVRRFEELSYAPLPWTKFCSNTQCGRTVSVDVVISCATRVAASHCS